MGNSNGRESLIEFPENTAINFEDSSNPSMPMASTSRGISSLSTNTSRPKLGFHAVHGEHVRISKNGKLAKRVESFCKGLAFSDRPIEVDEIVCLKFAEMATNWSGVLRFGVTNIDPATLAHSLPRFACPDLTSKEGNWAKALAERYCQAGSILHFYVRDNGELYYGINGVQKGLFLSGINTRSPVWVLVDIYGNSNSLEFLDPTEVPPLRRHPLRIIAGKHSAAQVPPPPQPNQQSVCSANNSFSNTNNVPSTLRPDTRVSGTSAEILGGISNLQASTELVRELSERLNLNAENSVNSWNSMRSGGGSLEHAATSTSGAAGASGRSADWAFRLSASNPAKFYAGVSFTPVPFHAVHGKNVVLTPDRTAALRTETEYASGYVFSNRPINLNEKIVIQVLNVVPAYQGGLAFGLTSCDPIHLRPDQLPDDSDLLLDRGEYWVVAKDIASSPKMSDELAFYITDEGQVHFARNNSSFRVIMHVDQTQKLWMFFDIYGSTQQIKILGATSVFSGASVPSRRLSAPFGPHTSSMPSMTSSSEAPSQQPQQLRVNLPSVPCGGGQRPLTPTQRPPLPPPRPPTVARPASVAGSSPVGVARTVAGAARKSSAAARVESEGSYNERECSVCMADEVDSVLYTCGHMCMCYECAMLTWEKKGECPVCRKPIQDVIKAFRT